MTKDRYVAGGPRGDPGLRARTSGDRSGDSSAGSGAALRGGARRPGEASGNTLSKPGRSWPSRTKDRWVAVPQAAMSGVSRTNEAAVRSDTPTSAGPGDAQPAATTSPTASAA